MKIPVQGSPAFAARASPAFGISANAKSKACKVNAKVDTGARMTDPNWEPNGR